VVQHRNDHGPFRSRQELLKVKGVGPKAFEQCAGFLRIRGASNPLDTSAVHPERYAVVQQMARDVGCEVNDLIGNAELVKKITLHRYQSESLGEFTLNDILAELAKPGRDPRAHFEAPHFDDAISSIGDLKAGMLLEGVVTNVTAFGAFVDVGVHQDGLVHVSHLTHRFVKDPTTVVSVGDKLKVLVLEVDVQRKRISLSAKNATPSNTKTRT
jgi:protein Tex